MIYISDLSLSGVMTLLRGKKKNVHTRKRYFLKHVLCDKNLPDSKRLHVKTAANYGEFVKDLMKGGDLLIESCGCILSPKISQHVFCTNICATLQITSAVTAP